jgi:hypothetical protein
MNEWWERENRRPTNLEGLIGGLLELAFWPPHYQIGDMR